MTVSSINFAPTGWRRALWQMSATRWALLVLALGAGAATLTWGWQLQAQLQEQQRRIERLQSQLQTRQERLRPQAAPGVTAAQAEAINTMVRQLNRPWSTLRRVLDETSSNSVALLAVAPDAQRHQLHISAEARDSASMLTYLRQLQRHEFFEQVLLTHHEVVEQDPQHPLRFELEARWSAP